MESVEAFSAKLENIFRIAVELQKDKGDRKKDWNPDVHDTDMLRHWTFKEEQLFDQWGDVVPL